MDDKQKNILLLALAPIFIGVIFLWSEVYFSLVLDSNKIVDFTVQNGEGAKQISIALKEQGLIRRSSIFRTYTLFRGISKKLQAGQYELSPSMSIAVIANKISKGDVIREKIVIIEGWDLKDIGQYFEDNGISTQEEFSELIKKDFSQGISSLEDKPKGLSFEGYLFPDTYEVIPGTSAENIIRKILSNFDQKLTPGLREEISRQKKSIFEIITMASLIEKEVKTLEDKKDVSGVLWKRIKIGMPLQVDATVVYITGRKSVGVSAEEKLTDSPYNTYMHYGLPIAPISNPGLDSIIAAIYPNENDFLYYLSTPTGETIFSKTFEEHNNNIDKYLR